MLFLFNDVVFELGDVIGVLNDGEIPLPMSQLETLTPAHLSSLVREAIFHDPFLAQTKPEHTRHLAALIAHVAPAANALLAVRYPEAEGPDGVGLRFANVPMPTLAYLWAQQGKDELTPAEINSEVWAHVTANLHTGY